MSDARIGFLYKAASTLLRPQTSQAQSILRSYYLIRCMQITKGYGLPDRHFSPTIRCPHCCIEWRKETDTKIKPVKLSKRQKKRIKSRKSTKKNPDPKSLLDSNELERICSFCKHSTVTPLIKPKKEEIVKTNKTKCKDVHINEPNPMKTKVAANAAEKKAERSIYCNAREVYSLNNKHNALTTGKETKVIKNNKRRKDKFAGLCQQAVLTSAKLKELKDVKIAKKTNENKLLSFLKTSS